MSEAGSSRPDDQPCLVALDGIHAALLEPSGRVASTTPVPHWLAAIAAELDQQMGGHALEELRAGDELTAELLGAELLWRARHLELLEPVVLELV